MTILPYSLLMNVTDIGDAASLLAITVAGSLYLFSRKSSRAGFFLLTSFLLAVLSIAVMKFAFLSCKSYFHLSDVHSPSGHAALSAAALWSYAILMRRHLAPERQYVPLLILSLLIAAICTTRVMLHFHSQEEVWVGLGAGIVSLCIAYFFVLKGKSLAPYDAYALALWGVIAAFVAHGTRMPAENLIHLLAFHMKGHVLLCGA